MLRDTLKKIFVFPLCLGLTVVAVEASLALVMQTNAPPGTRWLGGTIQNTGDAAIYLSYIAQAATRGLTFINPFASETQLPRFDLVWSSLGLIARTGLSPLVTLEIARWFFTLILAFAVFAASRSIARTERDAKLATLLAFLGVGMGALYVSWTGVTNVWMTNPVLSPDIASEYAIAPMLIGGPHILLSIALVLTATRYLWDACIHPRSRSAWYVALLLAILFSFHPYYVALFAILYPICVSASRLYRQPRALMRTTLIVSLCGVSGVLIYGPLLADPAFFRIHNDANYLPLGPWYIWLVSLFPFLGALTWRWKNKILLRPEERWIVAWLIAVILALLLPLPWKRKLTEGAQIGLVLLTLPAWAALRDWLFTLRLRVLLIPLALLTAGFAPLQIFLSQLAWISQPDRLHWFYASHAVFDGFAEIRMRTPSSAVVTSDDRWLNFWIPAHTVRNSWVGHDPATTHFAEKITAWEQLMHTNDPVIAHQILQTNDVTDILLTRTESIRRFTELLEPVGWHVVWREGTSTALLERAHVQSLPAKPFTLSLK